jgi:hypothetical protein
MSLIQTRFVLLVDDENEPVCAPVLVELSDLSYLASDDEFEVQAIKLAVSDGVLKSDMRPLVRAHFDHRPKL